MKKVVGNSQYQKLANALLILQLLRKGPNTRASIARELGLQPSTVTYNINRLLDANLVRQASITDILEQEHEAPIALGRRAIALELNRDFGRVIGFELLADFGWASILDPAGSVLYSQQVVYPERDGKTAQERFEQLVETVVNQMVEKCGESKVLGVGIALPGIVESNGQAIRDCWTHALKGSDLSSFFKRTFDFPVILENDANCCVQRYLFEGAAERQDNFMYLLTRSYPLDHVPAGVSPFGIGLGLVFDGNLYRGSDSRAGEFMSALMPIKQTGTQLSVSIKDARDIADDATVRLSVLTELVVNIRTLASVLDPHIIYLGGFIADFFDEVVTLLPDELIQKVVFANAHNDASEGAAVHLLSLLYRIPQVGDSSPYLYLSSLFRESI
ncbi:MAG: ROK family protein [Sphaerochaetaceae bacterium]